MPRRQSNNTFQVSFKIPEDWLATADQIAGVFSKEGLTVTRTDALRAALSRGLTAIHAECVRPKRAK